MSQVVQLARLCGWMVYHTHDSRGSAAGFPDLVLVRPPRLLTVELKSARGRLPPAQREWLEVLEKCRQVEVYVWRPADWETIVERLK